MKIVYSSQLLLLSAASGLAKARLASQAVPLTQYTPDIKDWSTLNDKSVLQNSKNVDHNIDSVHWIDESAWLPWDGTPYNASQYSRRDLADLICPGNTILGLREVFYEANPFSDPVNPTKAEVDNWHRIAINHVRALVGYTEEEYQIEPNQCLHVRALWSEERKNTDIWDARYPDKTCVGSTNPHCGASFIPSVEDQQPYLPDGVESCGARAGSEGLFNAAKSNIPWSIRFIRPLCSTLGSEGFWGGHTGPWFHRKQFGFSWRDTDPDNFNSNAGLVAKWSGPKAPRKYVDPRITDGDFLLQVEGEDPNPRFEGYQCEQTIWQDGKSPNATDCYYRVVAKNLNKRFFTWKGDGGCAGYPAAMEKCKVVGSATRLTWDLDPRSFSFDGLMVDPDDLLWNNRECKNIKWKSEAKAGDPSQCLENLMALQYEDCGRNFMTWNSANGGCACYAPDQLCEERKDTVGRSGRKTYKLLTDPAYEPPSPSTTSTTAATTTAACSDVPGYLFRGKKNKDCEYVGKKAKKRCKKREAPRTADKTKVWDYCKATCCAAGFCKGCE